MRKLLQDDSLEFVCNGRCNRNGLSLLKGYFWRRYTTSTSGTAFRFLLKFQRLSQGCQKYLVGLCVVCIFT